MADIRLGTSLATWKGDANGSGQLSLFDASGVAVPKTKGTAWASTHGILPTAGVNDGYYRPVRVDRFGGSAQARFTTLSTYNLYTAALPPTWNATATTMTITHALSSGTLLNASAIVTASTNSTIVSQTMIPKYQKSPLQSRQRIRLSTKGGANAAADWGLISTQTPASAVPTAGFVFLYGIDGTLKPTVYANSTVVAQGTDFVSSITTDRYYVWDIILDDDVAIFICQDPYTGSIVSEQSLQIQLLDPRIGWQPWWFSSARTYVGGTIGSGAATQIYMSDAWVGILDTDTYKPWADQMASLGLGSTVNPTIALTQLENYTNSAAPASATLSNTTAGYTTLGGQFQFAAVAGAETDYALFGFTVPTGVKLIVKGIRIETYNTGAAVATTATMLQWFAAENGTAVTLAANNFRKSLGVQGFAIADAIGKLATPIDVRFGTPLVTHSGRFFHVGMKMPLGSATASQVIRGVVQIDAYFE